MKITAHQARQVRFTPRGAGYDQAEVNDFCRNVASVLNKYEDLVHQLEAVDAMGQAAEADAAAVTRSAHEEAMVIRLRAAEEVEVLEARVRMLEGQIAGQMLHQRELADAADPTVEDSPSRGGGDDPAAGLAAASADAAQILAAATAEGDALVRAARQRAAALGDSTAEEMQMVKKRLARLRSAVADIESRFRGLVGSTLEELALLGDLIALETSPLIDAVQLTTDADDGPVALPALPETAAVGSDTMADDVSEEPSAPGFYEKRLSGLRARLREHGA